MKIKGTVKDIIDALSTDNENKITEDDEEPLYATLK